MTDHNADLDHEAGPTSAGPIPESESTPTVTGRREFVGTGLFWGLVVGILLAIAVVILAAQNTGSTTIAFLGWKFSTPVIVLILWTLIVGVVFDELFGLVYRARRRRILRDRDQLKQLERSNPQ